MSDNSLLIKMGERIAKRRKSLKITQEELAERIGVSVPMISNLEQGKKAIRPENLIKVCSVLELSADYILTGKTADQSDYPAVLGGIDTLTENELALLRQLIDYMHSHK